MFDLKVPKGLRNLLLTARIMCALTDSLDCIHVTWGVEGILCWQ